MTDTTPTEKSLTGYTDDLDERLLRVEDRITDVEIAIENEKLSRRQDRETIADHVNELIDTTNSNAEVLTAVRGVLNYTIGVLLLHLTWHAVAKAVDWWRYR